MVKDLSRLTHPRSYPAAETYDHSADGQRQRTKGSKRLEI